MRVGAGPVAALPRKSLAPPNVARRRWSGGPSPADGLVPAPNVLATRRRWYQCRWDAATADGCGVERAGDGAAGFAGVDGGFGRRVPITTMAGKG